MVAAPRPTPDIALSKPGRNRAHRAARLATRKTAAKLLAEQPRGVLTGDDVIARIATWIEDGSIAALADSLRAWEPLPGLPGDGTRASCPPPTQPCPFVACRHHLARVESDMLPGRRWYGWTPTPVLRPIWLDENAQTCALNVAERVAASGDVMPVAAVGAAHGAHETQTRSAIRRALAKLGVKTADIAAIASDERATARPPEPQRPLAGETAAELAERVIGVVARLHAKGLSGECTEHGLAWRFGDRVRPVLEQLVADGRLVLVEIDVRYLDGVRRRSTYAVVGNPAGSVSASRSLQGAP